MTRNCCILPTNVFTLARVNMEEGTFIKKSNQSRRTESGPKLPNLSCDDDSCRKFRNLFFSTVNRDQLYSLRDGLYRIAIY